mgnify:CR=1 FL=1
MPPQSRSTWKALERRTAVEIGGIRNGMTGLATADAESDNLVVECKSWSSMPKRVVDALKQAERASGGTKVAVARIHAKNKDGDNDLAVVRWSVMIKLLRHAGLVP